MQIEALTICRDVLVQTYREKLGYEFGSSVAELVKGRRPVWRTVSGIDLTTERKSVASDNGGLLFDPEIGVLCYILPFYEGSSLRKQIARALTLRSQLSIERNFTGPIDESCDARGAWRIALHWLVETSLRDKWIGQVMEVRRETAFSEEVSMDAIFINEGDVRNQVVRHGFPRLLVTTREVFRKRRLDEISQWLSANKLVEKALNNFAASFTNADQRKLAEDVVKAAREFSISSESAAGATQAPEIPKAFHSIRIRNFRNLKDVRFDFGTTAASATIVHGPNGSGKSSLCEALSLTLFSSSFRYKRFSDKNLEKDVLSPNRGQEYIAKYLTPLDGVKGEPKIALDELEFAAPVLAGSERTEDIDLAMNGTVLTQDSSLEFARMPSQELGARVLRGYSGVADHLDQFTDSRVLQANSARQVFLRELGVSAAITKVNTAYQRIAAREIDLTFPPLPNTLVTWLESAELLLGSESTEWGKQWRAWWDVGRTELADAFAAYPYNEVKIEREATNWLNRYNELAAGSAEVIKSLEAKIDPIRTEFDNAIAQVSAWGEWLERRATASVDETAPEAALLAQRLQEIQATQNAVIERGRTVAGRVEHLTSAEAYVRETWQKENGNNCPTCGADHSARGGILTVVSGLRAETTNDRERLRQEFTELKAQIEGIRKQLADLGQVQCPLSSHERLKLSMSVQWLIPGSTNLEIWITERGQRESLLGLMAAVRQLPATLPRVEPEDVVVDLVKKVFARFRAADETFEAPTNWKPVKTKLTELMSSIVNEHLPHTLERLWRELALNLTAAPWLLPDAFRIDVVTRRGEQSSAVRINDRLARYILNQSEIHTLGLAWFFTRHLTWGRFFHSCIVMDDPAHEMDQTSFRDLCRLWETLMRLHRVYERSLKLIVMLNQESRAVEAARASGAILSVLGWEREQEHSVRSTSVIIEGFHAPHPAQMFAAAS